MGQVAKFWARFVGLKMQDRVIVRTDRGVEVGSVLSMPTDMGTEEPSPAMGEVLRRVTPKDIERLREIEEEIKPKEMKLCDRKIAEHQLLMKLADVEHLFGGTKIIFYFLAEGRVDFRELVKDLAQKFHTRIEMRQIGVRDEAGVKGGYGPCGRNLCCSSFLNEFAPVSIRMAKDQNLSLNPSKISGMCGRLMCCLRYEHTPKEGAASPEPATA